MFFFLKNYARAPGAPRQSSGAVTAISRVLFWSICLVVIGGCAEPEVSECCSCLCKTADDQGCGGARLHALAGQTCAQVCQTFCVDRRCEIRSAETLYEGECPGGLLPFL